VAESQIWVSSSMELESVKQLTNSDLPMGEVRVRPDGHIISIDGNGALWIMNGDGAQRSAFGSIPHVAWFDTCGRSVVLTSIERNSTALLRLDADGTSVTRLASGNLWSPTCSPDNRFVYYVNVEQPEMVWRMATDGGVPMEVAQVLGDSIMGNLTISPDGKYLAYPYSLFTGTTPGRHLAVIPLASGAAPVGPFDMPGDAWNVGPYWNSEGTALEYIQNRDGVANIWEQSLAGGPPRQLTHFSSGHIFDFTWSANRRQLFLTRGKISSDVVLLSGLPD
jgi:Tol biopolymer transport system component